MTAFAEIILFGMGDSFVPCGIARKSKSAFYQKLVMRHILDPLVARAASCAIFRGFWLALALSAIVHGVGAASGAGIKGLTASLTSRPLFDLVAGGAVAALIVHLFVLGSMWILPSINLLTAPGDYFDGTGRTENPVKVWLFNAFAGVPMEGDWKQRLQDLGTFANDARDAGAVHNGSRNQQFLKEAVEARGFDASALRDAVGSASMAQAASQAIGLAAIWGLMSLAIAGISFYSHSPQ